MKQCWGNNERSSPCTESAVILLHPNGERLNSRVDDGRRFNIKTGADPTTITDDLPAYSALSFVLQPASGSFSALPFSPPRHLPLLSVSLPASCRRRNSRPRTEGWATAAPPPAPQTPQSIMHKWEPIPSGPMTGCLACRSSSTRQPTCWAAYICPPAYCSRWGPHPGSPAPLVCSCTARPALAPTGAPVPPKEEEGAVRAPGPSQPGLVQLGPAMQTAAVLLLQ